MEKARRSVKLTAMVLSLILLIVTVAGCSQKTSENNTTASASQSGTVKDPLDKSQYYEITLLSEDPKLQQYKDKNSFLKLLKEKFNFGINYVTMTGDVKEWMALRLASGDYPEIIRLVDEKFVKAYVEAGALIPLNDLIDKYGTNIKETHKTRIPYWKVMSGLDDGKIWFYTATEPAMSYGVSVAINEWKIRSDILVQQGYPEVRNEEDVYNIVKKGLKDNPTTNGQPTVGFGTPLRDPGSIECAPYLFNTGRLSHMTLKNNSIYDPKIDKFINPVEDYDWKAGLLFYNKMWREGMVDKDVLTYSSSEFQNKMATGYGLSTFFYGWNWGTWNAQLEKAGKDFRYVPFPSLLKHMQERGDTKIYPITNGEIWSSYAFTKNAKYPERLMEVVNWCMSEEGLIRAGWGEAGVQYKVNEKGLRVPTAEFLEKNKSDIDYGYTWQGTSVFGLFAGLSKNGQNYIMSSDNEFLKPSIDPKVYDVYKNYGWTDIFDSHNKNKNFKADYAYPAGLSMIIPNYSDSQVKDTEKIKLATLDYTIKLITAKTSEEFEKNYTELIQKQKDLGIQALIDERNKMYVQLKKNIK